MKMNRLNTLLPMLLALLLVTGCGGPEQKKMKFFN